jgi:hypothetical protein
MKLSNYIVALGLFGVAIFSTSCITGSHAGKLVSGDSAQTLATRPPSLGKAAVVFCREAKIVGSAGSLRVRAEGDILVDVPNGTNVRCELAPGSHHFSMSSLTPFGEMPGGPECDLTLVLEPGKIRFATVTLTDALLGGGGLAEISPQRAAQFVAKNKARIVDAIDSK